MREVKRIEFHICRDESEAIKREAKLLLELRPKFNRAGVWPGKTKFIAWRGAEPQIQMAVAEVPEHGWLRCGPLRGSAVYVQQSLARVLWMAVNPSRNISEIPAGWMKGEPLQSIALDCGITFQEAMSSLESLLLGDGTSFFTWLDQRLNPRSNPFERNEIAAELEVLAKFLEKKANGNCRDGTNGNALMKFAAPAICVII